jgi:hypothetical protein
MCVVEMLFVMAASFYRVCFSGSGYMDALLFDARRCVFVDKARRVFDFQRALAFKSMAILSDASGEGKIAH